MIELKIRQADFTTFSRQRRLQPPANGTSELYDGALELFEAWLGQHPGAGIRLLGVGGSEFAAATQGDLFELAGRAAPTALDRTVDDIRRRFGSIPVGRARTFDDDQIG